MKRTLLVALALAVAVPAYADTRIQVNIGTAPPPPLVVFHHPPAMRLVPAQGVYVVGGPDLAYDCFRFGAFFYIYNDGWWYRASRYGGPYRAIEARYVPRPIFMVPPSHWRHPHGMPPGQAKKIDRRGYDRGHGNDHGNGRGRDHGRD
jgi:hypothetical protein